MGKILFYLVTENVYGTDWFTILSFNGEKMQQYDIVMIIR